MKKIFKGLLCAGLCGVLALGAAGCTKKTGPSEHRNTETDALRLAIGACDEKFNPLFYTSQNDGEIANMTQASLITADKNGDLAVGDNYPVATLDYKETYYSASGAVLGTGDGKTVSGTSDKNGSTTYEFLIKNGMKFSDGKPLTVMDVLFNLYVYLDPMYSGSSTIYSTKIKGLQAYRRQDITAGDNSTSSTTKYYAKAMERVNALIYWSEHTAGNTLTDSQKADLEKVKELYREELNSDWASIETGWKESYKKYKFTEAWQVFYYIEGLVKNQTVQNEYGSWENVMEGEGEDAKYLTTLDPNHITGEIEDQDLINDMATATTEDKVNAYMSENEGVSRENAVLALQKAHAIEHMYNSNTADTRISFVLNYCNTASTALEYFMRDEQGKEFEGQDMKVPTVSGITVSRTSDEAYGGKFNGKTYADDHDVLRIEINGIDPKAKWNFGFTVAPMHYYSSKELSDKAMKAYNDGTVYTTTENGVVKEATCTDFGVKFNNIDFFDKELASSAKNGLPVGAGAYKCCTYKYNSTNLSAKTFFYNYMAFFERNEYFETMGEGIENAKIKYVTYKVTQDDKIVEALKTNEIDYGEPTATSDNERELNTGNLKQVRYLAGGYGYVGINPKYVPDMEVRRAIMKAFDTSSIIEYYGESLVNMINRPMSTTSWASPDKLGTATSRYYAPETDVKKLREEIEKEGNWTYSESDRKLHNINGDKLSLTFTIAGETIDHPSYNMFVDAQRFLNEVGFDITVQTDLKALQKLATGNLAVWAAAWSSSIDPDPYQIYSLESNASSTKNWNKDGIIRESTGRFKKEYEIALKINEYITQGRQTLNQADRIEIYGKCLDEIMELAVEFPTYQHYNLCVYNSAALEASSMHISDASYNMGPLGELWKVTYKD